MLTTAVARGTLQQPGQALSAMAQPGRPHPPPPEPLRGSFSLQTKSKAQAMPQCPPRVPPEPAPGRRA